MKTLIVGFFFLGISSSCTGFWNNVIRDNIYTIIRKLPLATYPTNPSIKENDVAFYYTNQTMGKNALFIDDTNITVIDNTMDVIYIVHGWLESHQATWIAPMVEAFFQRSDYHIVLVDSSKPFNVSYPEAAANTKLVGDVIARHIFKTGVSPSMIQIIGFDLGGQAAGFAGKILQGLSNKKVGRITGLDPAKPLFEGSNPALHLHRSDASFVDITHSDAGGFGLFSSEGTVDFYVNTGSSLQPGCPFVIVLYKEDVRPESFPLLQCSHRRSISVFIESINSHNFIGTKCSTALAYFTGLCKLNDVAVYGQDVPLDTKGVYYFMTNASPQYANGV